MQFSLFAGPYIKHRPHPRSAASVARFLTTSEHRRLEQLLEAGKLFDGAESGRSDFVQPRRELRVARSHEGRSRKLRAEHLFVPSAVWIAYLNESCGSEER